MAGLSAAHELAHRGYVVSVFESGESLGGKSTSQRAPNLPAGSAGRKPLFGEHGFRFFPGFYQNVIATLREIPRASGQGTVADDLVPSPEAGITWNGQLYRFPRRGLGASFDVLGHMKKLFGALDFTATDIARMAWFRLKYLTSGPLRRASYDAIPWWQFIDGTSPQYSARALEFEESIPRTMSAMAVKTSSAKVVGDITMQFLLGVGRPAEEPDRLLVGPTTLRWLDPWRDHLAGLGVTFATGHALQRFSYTPGTKAITDAVVLAGGAAKTITADYYLAALPIEVMQAQLKGAPGLAADDPDLAALSSAPPSTAWMVGVQFYLAKDAPMAAGHVFYPKSPWALTSVSQGQFWSQSGQSVSQAYGDGTVNGVLSVIVADWETKSPASGLAAREYTSEKALLAEVRRQILAEAGGTVDLSATNVVYEHLDQNLAPATSPTTLAVNRSPLLVHPVNGLAFRPRAHNQIANLFLASDYVRTSTELATMEGANEAARRAVNAILDADASPHVRCPVWELREEPIFDAAKQIDDQRMKQGRPHVLDELPIALASGSPGLVDTIQTALQVPTGFLAAI